VVPSRVLLTTGYSGPKNAPSMVQFFSSIAGPSRCAGLPPPASSAKSTAGDPFAPWPDPFGADPAVELTRPATPPTCTSGQKSAFGKDSQTLTRAQWNWLAW